MNNYVTSTKRCTFDHASCLDLKISEKKLSGSIKQVNRKGKHYFYVSRSPVVRKKVCLFTQFMA